MNTRALPFSQLDVFSGPGLLGNPLAVVHEADSLDTATMQQFAEWTNLSETTFLLAPTTPDADYRVRIFAGRDELPFAGHPTLGSAAAWLAAGGTSRDERIIVQECEAGLVLVRRSVHGLSFAAPPLTRYEPVEERLVERIAVGLRITRERIVDASWLVNGPKWVAVLLSNADEVHAVSPDAAVLQGLSLGVAGRYPRGADVDLEVRALFVPPGGMVIEDPVTGSLNAGLGRWLIDTGRMPSAFVVSQGAALGRAGRVHLEQMGADLWVGGQVTSVIQGSATFE